jgi:CTP:molybdopterin cytidylyltransferase MocA
VIVGVVLAAGAARRFGARKQLAPFRGRPLVEHAVAALAGADLDAVIVVLGADADAVERGADLRPARVVRCADAALGQSHSLRAGVAAAGRLGATAVVVVLGDQPLIAPGAVRRVVAAAAADPEADAVRATYGGVPGHPVLLRRSAFPAVATLEGDRGARDLLATLAVVVVAVACDGQGSPADVDTPDDLAAL